MISALVHTYNEEANIKRCLNSLKWADEIVVIDMESTDNTRKIAREFTNRIYKHPYTGFVESARNWGLSKIKGDWVLILDADEEIPSSLSQKLKNIQDNSESSFYRIPRKNIIFGKWIRYAGWWPDYQIRFFQKGSVTWLNKIHAVPVTSGNGEDLEKTEKNAIVHHHYLTLEQYIERLNRYTSIAARELDESGIEFSKEKLFQKPVQEFINRYFVWQGYKEGIHGLGLSLLQSFSELVLYMKLWQIKKFPISKYSLPEIEKELNIEYKNKKYWLLTEKIKKSSSFFDQIILKIKRKFLKYV